MTHSSSSFAWPRKPIAPAASKRRSPSYLKLLAVRPYHAELHNNLGVALRLAGKLEASVSHHRLSLAADPNNPALHSNLGNALRAANRLDEAVKHHFHSITLNRDYGEGFFNLALCLRDLGRIDEAVGCFGRALALNPDNRRARVELAIALLMRGELAQGFRRLRGAQASARDAGARLPPTGVGRRTDRRQAHPALSRAGTGRRAAVRALRPRAEAPRRHGDRALPGAAEGPLGTVDFIDHVVAEGEACPSSTCMPRWCRCRISAAPTSTRRRCRRLT
jgi:tetratricopeptide (TPR) repeat protein